MAFFVVVSAGPEIVPCILVCKFLITLVFYGAVYFVLCSRDEPAWVVSMIKAKIVSQFMSQGAGHFIKIPLKAIIKCFDVL